MARPLPKSVTLIVTAAVLLAGPAAVFAFLLGGALVGGVTVLAFALVFTGIYIWAVRKDD